MRFMPEPDRQKLNELLESMSETVAYNRELRATARELLNDNRDLRDFLKESLLQSLSRRSALNDRSA